MHHANGPHACKDGSFGSRLPTNWRTSSELADCSGLDTLQEYIRTYQASTYVRSARHRIRGSLPIEALESPFLIDARRCAKLNGTRAKETLGPCYFLDRSGTSIAKSRTTIPSLRLSYTYNAGSRALFLRHIIHLCGVGVNLSENFMLL